MKELMTTNYNNEDGKMKYCKIFRWLLLFGFCFPQIIWSSSIQVAFLDNTNPADQAENDAAYQYLYNIPGIHAERITIDDILVNGINSLTNYQIVWYHRPDSSDIQDAEISVGSALCAFVKNGGKMFLTMDAVRLLNTWNVDPNPVEIRSEDIVDEGFGRKLGFHANRNHSLFSGLNGGAYVWHGKEDHCVRKTGYFEDNLPGADGAQIIGIDWAYIFYREDSKLVWETPYGKGSFLAVGAYLYFGRENFNRKTLEIFTENCIRYLNREQKDTTDRCWNYDKREVVQSLDKIIDSQVTPISEKLVLPPSTLEHNYSGEENNYWDLAGRRMLVMGREKGGIDEIWTHPFMGLRDFEVGIRSGKEEIIWLNDQTPFITIRPDVMIRKYTIGSVSLKEIVTVAIDQPIAFVRYEWDSQGPSQLIVQLKSNLRLMWPYSSDVTGSIYYAWSDESGIFSISNSTKDLNTLIGFSVRPEKKYFGRFKKIYEDSTGDLAGTNTDKLQVAGRFEFNTNQLPAFEIRIVSGAEESGSNALLSVSKMQNVLLRNAEHYDSLFNQYVEISSPDSIFNEGYRWALASTDQFIAETPGVGTSLMAGYGTSRSGWGGGHLVSGRPGYAWYFGRDAVWSGLAVADYGDFETVRRVLDNFNRYMSPDGKIYHELTTSGSVHYDAADATPLYILLAIHYMRSSGDVAYIRDNWKYIRQAMDYCYSTDTDGDGLIENTNVGHGWVEGGELFGAHTNFYLAGLWAAALSGAAEMADAIGDQVLYERYRCDAERTKATINANFWNEERQHFNFALKKDSTYIEERTLMPVVPIYLNIIDKAKANLEARNYAGYEFSADWGVRIIEKSNPLYKPNGYNYGSIYPLFTGWAALAEYQSGRYCQGFTHIMNNLLNYRCFDFGSLDEVLHGEVYKPSGICRHQCWSETMVIQPLIEGMLGYLPDAPANRLDLSPRIPQNWNFINVQHLKCGKHSVDIQVIREKNRTVYILKQNELAALTINFRPLFPHNIKIKSVRINGRKVKYNIIAEAGGTTLELENLQLTDRLEIEVRHTNGVATIPVFTTPTPGDSSRAIRLIDEQFESKTLILELEGIPGSTNKVSIFAASKIVKIEGSDKLNSDNNITELSVTLPESRQAHSRKTVRVTIK